MQSSPIPIVGHTAELGGAERALAVLLRASSLPLTPVVLDRGPLVGLLAEQGTPARTPDRRSGLMGTLAWLRRSLRSSASPVVVSNTLRATLLVAVAKPRSMAHIAYLRDGIDAGSLARGKRAMAKWALARCAGVLVNSRWTEEGLRAALPDVSTSVVYTTSGVTDARWREGAGSAPAEGARRRIVFVGRLVEWKGPHVLIAALGMLREQRGELPVDVMICGTPLMGTQRYADALRVQAERAGIAAAFPGEVDVREHLRSGDILVHCSIRPEPFGQVIVQGAAAGMCVVAPNAGGPVEVLGAAVPEVLYEPADVSALATLLGRLLDDPALIDLFGRRARFAAGAFTDERIVALIDEAIEARRHPVGVTAGGDR